MTVTDQERPAHTPEDAPRDAAGRTGSRGLVTPGDVLRGGEFAEFAARAREYAAHVADRHGGMGDAPAEESPEQVRESVRAMQADIARDVWNRLVDTWPDHDLTGVALDKLAPEQQPRAIAAWLASPSPVLLLTGNAGRGKTYAAFAAAAALAADGVHVRATTHKRYLDSLRPDGSPEPPWVLRRRAQEAPSLVLDDLAAEMDPTVAATDFVRTETIDLLSARLGPGKRTVITTNASAGELGDMFGDRIMSRLAQDSAVISLTGPDRRRAYRNAW